MDSGNLVMLTLLDLPAAFDGVDHHTLLQRLRESYGLNGKVIDWFTSYLSDRVKHVRTTTSVRRQCKLSMEYHRAQSLDLSCFSCTLPTCCSSLNVTISCHTDTQTTPKSTGTVNRLKLVVSYSRFPSALTTSQRG